MPIAGRLTLAQFMTDERRGAPAASGDFDLLIADIALACKAIAKRVGLGVLAATAHQSETRGEALGAVTHNDSGDEQKPLDLVSNEIFIRATEWGGHLAGMVSEEMAEPYVVPSEFPRGKYLLLFDPLDGSSNIDVNMTVGSVFSVLRASTSGDTPTAEDFLRPGIEQVCAGYAIYGPSTMLVLTIGKGTHSFILDPSLGEWVLSHRDIQIPHATREFAINASNRRHWEPAVDRYVEECLQGHTGPRGVDFNMRWIASLVAETHRILMRGGVFLYPCDTRELTRHGRLRMLYETNPIAFLIEQADGMASNGHIRAMLVQPHALHQRTGFVFGSRDEVERIERYHREETT